jgi:flagellar biosynthesis repressor protein FlbT
MPLNIELRPHEKLFLNGAVISNGPGRTQFTLLNDAAVLREKDILNEERADSPCKRLYFTIQLMYMDSPSRAVYLEHYRILRGEVAAAAPSATAMLDEIDACVAEGEYYRGLKGARKLIDYEQELLKNVRP